MPDTRIPAPGAAVPQGDAARHASTEQRPAAVPRRSAGVQRTAVLRPVPTAAEAAPSEVTIVCPECGTPCAVSLSRRDADDFCPTCDYPMFWARPQERTGGAQDGADDARWRSPGASGALRLATVPCPACQELNLPSAVLCVRCGAEMAPPPPPEPAPLPLPQPVVVVPPPVVREPEPPLRFPWWWYAAMLAVAGIAWYVSTRY